MHALLIPVLVMLAVACGGAPTSSGAQTNAADNGSGYYPGASWRTADPTTVGFDANGLSRLRTDVAAGRWGSVHGVIIVRNGWLVHEQYAGWSAATPHTMQSVTKSITSLLYGMATGGGAGGALDRPVLELFARYPSVANTDARKRALTMRHLLTMRTAMDFWEQPYNGSPLQVMNNSSADWTKYILDRPMTGEPGSGWAYNSGAAILVGSAIREITGEQPDVFARRALFAPIGVTGETWFRAPFDGLPHTGGGLALKPLDLARVGYLVLRHGAWNDTQVVPRAWLDSSVVAVTHGSPVFWANDGAGYGRFWWLFPTTRGGRDDGIITASGSGGQWLFVVPSLDLVVAIVAANGDGLGVLYDGVLPALRR
jgi:CubicO group peptidase (beta-lactamase class C family)